MPELESEDKRVPPYSLGKLIDWKQMTKGSLKVNSRMHSLLAREINWLETSE